MTENKIKLIDEYLTSCILYEKKYGKDRTIVVMQVGSFFEMYATNNQGPDLENICSLLNIAFTRKDKSINDISKNNPYMCGFPTQTLNRFVGILIQHGYTVIVIEQTTLPPKPKREVTHIFSQGTSINHVNTADTNNIVCIFIEYEQQLNGKWLPCIGLSSLDITTGKNIIYEAYSTLADVNYALDEASRFILATNPREIVFYFKANKSNVTEDKIIEYLEIEENKLFRKGEPDKISQKIDYKIEVLKKVYTNIDVKNLEINNLIYGSSSFIYLLNFAYEHNNNIIGGLHLPEYFMNEKYLVLGNDAIRQLNILENDLIDSPNKKIKCLFDIINNTHTAMGRRFLKKRLTYPLIDYNEINKCYQDTEDVINNDHYINIRSNLIEISDIERLERKMSLYILQPCELLDFINSYKSIKNILEYVIENKLININVIKFDKINKFIDMCDKTFIYEQLKIQNLTDMQKSIFVENICMEATIIENEINDQLFFIDNLQEQLSLVIDEKIYLKKNIQDGYYFSITLVRGNKLKEYIKNNDLIYIKNVPFKTSNLIFKTENKNGYKIILSDEEDRTEKINTLKKQLHNVLKNKYIDLLKIIYNEYNNIFTDIVSYISYLDFICSNARTSTLYNYVRPIIDTDSAFSYIEATSLRHPIVERIIDYPFIPNDVLLNKDNSMLLFGLNSAGKSVYMKSVIMSIIIAQSGLFVPAIQYKYSIYKSVYTRITANDNIIKGLSSFSLEILELGSLLQRSGPNTLVCGDEVCKSTETNSALAIVSATLVKLSKSQTSFIFATHMHNLAEIKDVQELNNIKICHIAIEYDDKNDQILYNRVLQSGIGPSDYGTLVSRYLIKDSSFNNLVNKIKNDIKNRDSNLVSTKKSSYNSKLFVNECSICNKRNIPGQMSRIETHHILYQQHFNLNGFSNINKKEHTEKNSLGNLITICNTCHDNIHNGSFDIEKINTSKGVKTIIKNNKINKII